jgi:hypothetical protein
MLIKRSTNKRDDGVVQHDAFRESKHLQLYKNAFRESEVLIWKVSVGCHVATIFIDFRIFTGFHIFVSF